MTNNETPTVKFRRSDAYNLLAVVSLLSITPPLTFEVAERIAATAPSLWPFAPVTGLAGGATVALYFISLRDKARRRETHAE